MPRIANAGRVIPLLRPRTVLLTTTRALLGGRCTHPRATTRTACGKRTPRRAIRRRPTPRSSSRTAKPQPTLSWAFRHGFNLKKSKKTNISPLYPPSGTPGARVPTRSPPVSPTHLVPPLVLGDKCDMDTPHPCPMRGDPLCGNPKTHLGLDQEGRLPEADGRGAGPAPEAGGGGGRGGLGRRPAPEDALELGLVLPARPRPGAWAPAVGAHRRRTTSSDLLLGVVGHLPCWGCPVLPARPAAAPSRAHLGAPGGNGRWPGSSVAGRRPAPALNNLPLSRSGGG